MNPAWYALYVQVNHERRVRALLERKDVTCFLPLLETWSKRQDRRQRISIPLFRGYVFVHSHLDNHANVAILKTPGAITLLRNSEGPMSIPDRQIQAIQIMQGAAQPFSIHDYLHEGDKVTVVRGPLVGCTGVLSRLDEKKGRLIVNVDILGKSISVEINIEDTGDFAH